MKWLIAITGTMASDGQAYASPIIDRRDGRIAAHATGSYPNAQTADTMLWQAIATLPGHVTPIVHSDLGRHHRWPGRIRTCQKRGIIRPTGTKGRSS